MARYLAVGNLNTNLVWEGEILSTLPDVDFLHTGPGPDRRGLQKRPTLTILNDARRQAYDLVFATENGFPCFNPRKSALRNLSRLVTTVTRHPRVWLGFRFPYARAGSALAAVDMRDSPIIDNSRFGALRQAVCYFKRELPQNPANAFLYTTARTEENGNVYHVTFFQNLVGKLRPISIGVGNATVQKCQGFPIAKSVDVFFAGQVRDRPNRQAGLKQLERLQAEGYRVDITRELLPADEFLRRCAQARIVWSPEGFGWDCVRHYEAALAGSVPLLQSPTIRRYMPFEAGEQALYYYIEGEHLAETVRQALQNPERLAMMGWAARQHVLRWHTHEALARYIVEETRRTLTPGSPTKLSLSPADRQQYGVCP